MNNVIRWSLSLLILLGTAAEVSSKSGRPQNARKGESNPLSEARVRQPPSACETAGTAVAATMAGQVPSRPSPTGPCQCYDPLQDESQYCVGYQGSCEELKTACRNGMDSPTCAEGTPCQVQTWCDALCGILTDGSGQQVGWTAECYKTWRCYYCD